MMKENLKNNIFYWECCAKSVVCKFLPKEEIRKIEKWFEELMETHPIIFSLIMLVIGAMAIIVFIKVIVPFTVWYFKMVWKLCIEVIPSL